MRLCLIGNPDNRRIALNQSAALELGMHCHALAWRDYPEWLGELDAYDLVKIESSGEDEVVLAQQEKLGGVTANDRATQLGELRWMSDSHRGFCRQLQALNSSVASFVNPPDDIELMFDKWACHKLFTQAGIARPASFLAPDNVSDFLERINELTVGGHPVGRLFLKPLHGSSASGVLAFRWQGEQLQIIAPIEIVRRDSGETRFFNSLNIRSYLKFADIKAILQHLLPHGMIAEQWLGKSQIDSCNVDARIVVVAGKACHFIARKSPHPMTNLHLGSERVSRRDFATAFGSKALTACNDIAEQAANCFPDSLYAGVDVMLTKRLKPVVLEINAFGDLLPNVLYQGKSTYLTILESAKKHARSVV